MANTNEQRHTPGPWRFVGVTVYALHGEPPRNRFSALVQSGRRDDASEEERMANATLMAAAPELLEALEDILDLVTEGLVRMQGAKIYPAGQQRIDDARAVIAKATGAAS